MAVRVLLAEDVHMVRGALIALLHLEQDIEVVADVSSGDEVVPTALRCTPDVAVIDIDLPGTDGLTAAARLHERLPSCRTLILTSVGWPGTLRKAMAAHATGYLRKDAPPGELATAVRRVASGDQVVDPELALLDGEDLGNPLSPREVQVLRIAAEGAEPFQIAAQLHLSLGTVRNYLTAAVVKLGARNRVDAIRLAQQEGWML